MTYLLTLRDKTTHTIPCSIIHQWIRGLGQNVSASFEERRIQIQRFLWSHRPYLIPQLENWEMKDE